MSLNTETEEKCDVAAGWYAGDEYMSRIYLFPCRPRNESNGPWRWQIEVGGKGIDRQVFQSLIEFMDWYAGSYDRFSRDAKKGYFEEGLADCPEDKSEEELSGVEDWGCCAGYYTVSSQIN